MCVLFYLICFWGIRLAVFFLYVINAPLLALLLLFLFFLSFSQRAQLTRCFIVTTENNIIFIIRKCACVWGVSWAVSYVTMTAILITLVISINWVLFFKISCWKLLPTKSFLKCFLYLNLDVKISLYYIVYMSLYTHWNGPAVFTQFAVQISNFCDIVLVFVQYLKSRNFNFNLLWRSKTSVLSCF